MKKVKVYFLCAAGLFFLCGCSLFPTSGEFNSSSGKGVFFSGDKGASWQERNNIKDSSEKIDRFNVIKLEFDSLDSRMLYIGTDRGLFFSDDSGVGWKAIFSNARINDFALNPKTRGIIYAAVGNQVFKTTDNGVKWDIKYTETRLDASIMSIVVSHFDSSRIYVLNSEGYVMLSTDWGDSWKLLNDFKKKTKKIFMNPLNSLEMYVVAENEVFRTRDEGVSWDEIIRGQNQYFPQAEEYRDMMFSDSSGFLFYISKFGLLKSKDKGASWQEIKIISSPGTVDIAAFAVNPKNESEMFYIVNNILYHTLDGGLNWRTKIIPFGGNSFVSALKIDFYNDSNLYIGLRQ